MGPPFDTGYRFSGGSFDEALLNSASDGSFCHVYLVYALFGKSKTDSNKYRRMGDPLLLSIQQCIELFTDVSAKRYRVSPNQCTCRH